MLNMCLKKDPALIVRDKDNNSRLLQPRNYDEEYSPHPFSAIKFAPIMVNTWKTLGVVVFVKTTTLFINGHNMSLGSLSDQPYDIPINW